MNKEILKGYAAQVEEIRQAGTFKAERIITTPQRSRIDTTEKPAVVNMCANNYLGLSNDPDLIAAAKAEEANYAVDIYPHYGSDVEATLSAGYDIRHGLIGPGVYASHGYERSHKDGVLNTLKVLKGYIL